MEAPDRVALAPAPVRPALVTTRLFDLLLDRWEAPATRRLVATLLVVAFAGTLLAIELRQRGLLPAPLFALVPPRHFQAVELVFHVLLFTETVGLVFGVARSVANAAGKQFEIFSLILLRQSFEEFVHLDEPVVWAHAGRAVLHVLSDGVGALLIFVVLGFYYRAQRHRPLSDDVRDRDTFIAAKKAVALLLLAVLGALGAQAGWAQLRGAEEHAFFESFYSLLILADILIVLISLRYSSTYRVVFRNSGLAVATLLLRLALSAPPFWNATLGLAAVLYGFGLTLAYNATMPVTPEELRQVGVGH